MDNDAYVLISKAEIENLRKENANLLKKINSVPKSAEKINKENDNYIDKIVKTIHNESKKEREIILDKLHSVDKLNNRVSEMVKLLIEFNESVRDLNESINAGKVIDNFDSDKLIKEVKDAIALNNDLEINAISDKLDEISSFVENLRVLLSQIKPNDMKLN